MSSTSLLDALGGRDGVRRTVVNLYERILDDSHIAGYFDDVDLPSLRQHMVDFLIAAVSGREDGYRGRPLAHAHDGLGITDDAFDRVVRHLHAVLAAHPGGEATADAVVARLAPLRRSVVV